MLTYTIIDWILTLLSLALTIIPPIYLNGSACLIGMVFYVIYPIFMEILLNLLSSKNIIQITNALLYPIVYSDSYNIRACGIEKWHPFDSCKYGTIYTQIKGEVCSPLNPPLISRASLLELGMSKWYLFKMCYSIYVSTLVELPIFFLPGAFVRQCLLDPMLQATSGSIYGAQLALQVGWAINLSGGYHHASLNSGGGFCIFPDITLVVKYLQRYHQIANICIVDLDAHQGNGYERDFINDASVDIVDFYNHYIYPGDGKAKQAITIDQHVDGSTSDGEYCHLLQKHLKSVQAIRIPQFIIYNAGTDIMMGDPLGHMQISADGIIQRDDIVFRWARNLKVPILMLLSGGYLKENTYVTNAGIIDFDDLDSQPQSKPQYNARNFQEENENIVHEPGMRELNQYANQLPQLERAKTPAYQMQMQRSQQQQQQQQEIIQNQSEESVSDNDHKSVVNQSIVDFKSELGDGGVEQEDIQQQVQPRVQELQRVDDNSEQQIQMQQQQPPPLSASTVQGATNPFPPKMEPSQIQELLDKDRRSFLTAPLMQNKTLQCYIRRDKSGLARLYPVYHVYTTDGNIYLFSAKKVVMNTTSNYVISMKKNEFSTRNRETFLGKVRSNFLGTEFILFDEGLNPKKCKDTSLIRTQLGIVYYESHIMQNKGPRKMKVLLPKVGDLNIPKVFQPLHSNEGIQFDYQNNKREFIEELVNKPPRWDPKMKAHVLNFYGRVDQPSVKNFQLVNPNNHNYIHLQFGRVDDLNFNLDFCFPISPLQAFQICVTSFDFKFACE